MLYKTITAAVLFAALIATTAAAEEKQCRSLDDIENYWKSFLQNTTQESRVNTLCRQNRQALDLIHRDSARNGVKKSDEEEATDERRKCAWEYLSLVYRLCQETERSLGLFHLDEARKSAKMPGQEEATNEHKKLAREYLGDAVMEKELPEVKILKPGNFVYEFVLKKGEQTGSWMEGERETTTHIYFFETTNYEFEVRFKNGNIVKVWDGERVPKKPDGPFKIVATDDTIVLIRLD
jgi:hypothetical protein